MGLSSGHTPGLDGVSNEFYKHFWNIIGYDVFDVLQESFSEGYLPKSYQRAILTLLPKKGDLTLLKNWGLVALLWSEYTILSKCLSIRLNKVLNGIIYKDQLYCMKDRYITDNLHLMRDVIDLALYDKKY